MESVTASKEWRIAVICGDAGGANAIIPVMSLLFKDPNFHLTVFSYRESRKILQTRGIDYIELSETMNLDEAIEILRNCQADLLFSDTSLNSLAQTSMELEKLFILVARKSGIPSLSVLDYWSNYTIRFSDNERHLIYLPDKIAVMDRQAFDDMVSENFPPEILVITGQPAFIELTEWREKFSKKRKTQIFKSLGVESNNFLVVFASEPVLSGNPLHTQYPGYTEETILTLLIDALEKIQLEIPSRIVLVIRPHPKEDPEKFRTIKSSSIRIIISTVEQTRDVVMSADLVTGITSTILIEAALLGCIVASLQPGLLTKDILPTNRAGLTQPVYNKEEMPAILKKLLVDPVIREKISRSGIVFNNEENSAQKVIKLIYSMLQHKKCQLTENES
jgi:hypothetical protein